VSIVSDLQTSQPSTKVAKYDVIVVGAGPYGLTAAAHLAGKGLHVAVFGKPMELWRDHMPQGMYLRSHWWATNLSDPQNKYSFARYFRLKKLAKPYPVPMSLFLDYALWFQKNAVPDVDETYVSSIERQSDCFVVTLEDGRVLQAKAVVMAIGVYYYSKRPEEYSGFPKELVSHAFDHSDYQQFKGKRLLVIGGGQSAVEYAALLLEDGAVADVHLVARHAINWLERDRSDERSLLEQISAPNAGIAPGWRNWALEYLPYLFHRFPQPKKDRYIRSNYQAAAADWLRERVLGKVKLHERTAIKELQVHDNCIDVELSDGQKLQVDHVLLGTGYEVHLSSLPMLHPTLAEQIQVDQDIPILNARFESSVPGLYFLGLSAVRSFGPLYRFVVGAKAAGKRVADAVAHHVVHQK
jgi:cation diffusion facilitator CzcD-associated flavoprotein CzcO